MVKERKKIKSIIRVLYNKASKFAPLPWDSTDYTLLFPTYEYKDHDIADTLGNTVTKVTQFPIGGRLVWSLDKLRSETPVLKVAFDKKLKVEQDESTIQVCPYDVGLRIIKVCQKSFDDETTADMIKETNGLLKQLVERHELEFENHTDYVADYDKSKKKESYDENELRQLEEGRVFLKDAPIKMRDTRAVFASYLQLLLTLNQFEMNMSSMAMDWVNASTNELKRVYPNRKL